MQFFGKLSYSWYLWHWPFLIFTGTFFPNCPVEGKLTACVVALVVAAAAHRFVENPIRFNSYLVNRPVFSLSLGAVITVCSLSAATLAVQFSTHLARTREMVSISSNVGDVADMSRDKCLSPEKSAELKICVFGDTSSPNNLLLFGDSHARQWFNPLRQIAETRRWKLTTIVKATCPATDITPPELRGELATNCLSWRAEAMQRILEMRPSVVFLGNASYYLGHKDQSGKRAISVEEWQEGTKRTLRTLTTAGLTVVSVRDSPLPRFDVPMCLQRLARHTWFPNSSCEIYRSEAVNPAVFEAEKSGARGLNHIHFLDFTDQFCQGDVCPAVQDGTVVYRDDNHLTGRFAESLLPAILTELDPILNSSSRSR